MEQLSKDKEILSKTIEVLRFPLAIAVIFIHITPEVVNICDTNFSLFSYRGFVNLLKITLSHVFPHIAVPCFFLISGLLFFINIKEWNWKQYKNKLSSRVSTLLIPYIVWNFTPWIFNVIILYIKGDLIQLKEYINEFNINIFYNSTHFNGGTSWLGNNYITTVPYDCPLWFLRELIFMTVLSPLIYFLIKRFNYWYIIILFIAFISKIWFSIPGLEISACFFFSLGAFISHKNINIISVVNKYKYIIIPLSIILLLLNIIYFHTETIIGKYIRPLFITTTVFTVIYTTATIVKKYNIKANKLLTSSCFFIYAFHAAPIFGTPLGICMKLLNYIIPGMHTIQYLVAPFFTAILGICILQIGKKLLPSVTKWYSGNR